MSHESSDAARRNIFRERDHFRGVDCALGEDARKRGRALPLKPWSQMKAKRSTFSAAGVLALGSLAAIIGCAEVPVRQSTLTVDYSSAGGGDGQFVPPTPIRMVEPFYPIALKHGGITGRVRVTALVDEMGRVQDAQVESATDIAFSAAALEAVRKWRFKPALRDGVPVPIRVSVPLSCSLEQ